MVCLYRWLAAQRHCYVEVKSRFQSRKTRRRHPNNLERLPIQRNRCRNRVSAPAKFPLPKSIADYRVLYAASLEVIALCKQPSQFRPHLQHAKKIAAHPQAFRVTRFAAPPQVEPFRTPRGYLRKSLLLLFHFRPLRARKIALPRHRISNATLVIHANFRQLLWRRHRQRPQQHRVQQLENRRIRSNSQCQRQNRHQRKRRIGPQQAHPQPHVALHPLQKPLPPFDSRRQRLAPRFEPWLQSCQKSRLA